METIREYKLIPTFGNSYGTGWKVMLDNFLRSITCRICFGNTYRSDERHSMESR